MARGSDDTFTVGDPASPNDWVRGAVMSDGRAVDSVTYKDQASVGATASDNYRVAPFVLHRGDVEHIATEQAKASILEYVDVFYNRRRLHSSIGYLSHERFERSVN